MGVIGVCVRDSSQYDLLWKNQKVAKFFRLVTGQQNFSCSKLQLLFSQMYGQKNERWRKKMRLNEGRQCIALSIEQILHLWDDHKLYLIMKFVICCDCSETVFFSSVNSSISTNFFPKWKKKWMKTPIEAETICVRHIQMYVKKRTYQQNSCEFFFYIQLSECMYRMHHWKYSRKLLSVWPEVFEWIIGQMYGVNIGVVWNILRVAYNLHDRGSYSPFSPLSCVPVEKILS